MHGLASDPEVICDIGDGEHQKCTVNLVVIKESSNYSLDGHQGYGSITLLKNQVLNEGKHHDKDDQRLDVDV
jgi:hypothetical protein